MNNIYQFLELEVGKRHPELSDADMVLMTDSNRLEMNEQGELTLFTIITKPRQDEIKDFKRLHAFGLYRTGDLKGGLWLWQFSKTFIQETPFNPTMYSDDRVKRMGRTNMMWRFLLDEHGIIRAMGVHWLHHDFLDMAKAIWTNPDIEWGDYSERLTRLYAHNTTRDLWNRSANKWITKDHLSLDADTAN